MFYSLSQEPAGAESFRPIFRKPMTMLAGVVCSDGIVVAAESQMTFIHEKKPLTKEFGVEKFRAFDFSGTPVLIAYSGSIDLAEQVLALISKQCDKVGTASDDAIARAIQECVLNIYRNEYQKFVALGISDVFKSINESGQFTLVCAYFHKQKPFLFDIHFHHPCNLILDDSLLTSGSGARRNCYYTDAIGKLIRGKTPNLFFAIFYCVCAIRRAKQIDEWCGGNIRVHLLKPGNPLNNPFFKDCGAMPQEVVTQIENHLPPENSNALSSVQSGFDNEADKFIESKARELDAAFEAFKNDPNRVRIDPPPE